MSDELMHYGVPGMKWGKRTSGGGSNLSVRAGKAIVGGVKAQRQKRYDSLSNDHKVTAPLKKLPSKKLSNQELAFLNQRQQLEAQRKKLNPNPVKKGELAVKASLATVGTGVAVYKFAQSPEGQKLIKNGKRIVENMMRQAAQPPRDGGTWTASPMNIAVSALTR